MENENMVENLTTDNKSTPNMDVVNQLQLNLKNTDFANLLVTKLTEAEVTRRVDLLNKLYNDIKTAQKDLKKISQPDVTNYDSTGNQVKMTSETRFKEIKAAKEKVDGLTKKFNDALTTGDFSKLG